MPFDKEKTLRAAEKYLEMGKIPAAVKEYCQLVENDPGDFTTLNILGDLYVRVGNKEAAVSCFRRIADHYCAQEFALKAIAMFKKIDRLQPNDLEIATNLANLYAQQDLVVEARTHYFVIANAHAKAGDVQAGLEVLRKIADIDPQNTEVRIKLGEGFAKEGFTKEAAASFTEAGHCLLAQGAVDEALEVFSKAVDIVPNDYDALSGLLAAHTARGTADEAADVIARACKDHPEDVELLSMLGSAQLEAEDAERAEETMRALIDKDTSAYVRLLDVARLFLSQERIDDSARIVQSISEQMLAERNDQRLLDLVNELLASDADNVQALRILVRIYWWQRDVDSLRTSLEHLVEAAEASGLANDERYALTQLTRLVPDETRYAERLNELGGAEAEAEAEVLPVVEVSDSSLSHAEFEAASSTPSEYEYEIVPDAPQITPEPATPMAPEVRAADAPEATANAAPSMEIERGFAFEVEHSGLSMPSENESSTSDEGRHATIRAQELESVDFYIAQGYVDIAVDTLDLLERQFGSHPDIERRRRRLNGEPEETTVTVATEPAPSDSFASFEITEPAAVAPPTAHPEFAIPQPEAQTPPVQMIDPGLAEIFEEFRESSEAESNGNGDYETHYNLGLAFQEMDLFEEALEEFQIAVGLVSPEDGTQRYLQCCNLLGNCFLKKGVPQLAIKWLSRGLDTPSASHDQRQALLFDLAAAYEQAGELNRAMDLFTEIYGVNVSYRGVNERLRALQSRMAAQ
jgi:tetratricopeptide (TPR) repeat protein